MEVEEKLTDFQKEIEVGLIEKQMQIEQAVQDGEIIPERAQLEIKKSQEMERDQTHEKNCSTC